LQFHRPKHKLGVLLTDLFQISSLTEECKSTVSSYSEYIACNPTKMGKKKQFIDKKSAQTYNLIYSNAEDGQPERTLATNNIGVGRPVSTADKIPPSTSRYPPGHPLAWLEQIEPQPPISEARRKELIELGFPDDGYDYLSHLRVLESAAPTTKQPSSTRLLLQQQRQQEGEEEENDAKIDAINDIEPKQQPSTTSASSTVFLPAPRLTAPIPDIKVFDASSLTLLQPAAAESDADGIMGGVTAFSRQRDPEGVKGMTAAELAELEAAMEAAEMMDSDDDGCGYKGGEEDVDIEGEVVIKGKSGSGGDKAAAATVGIGDLLDDFVLDAAGMGSEGGGVLHHENDEEADGEEGDDWSTDISSDEDDEGREERASRPSVGGTSLSQGSKQNPPKPGSIASTYWREERQDRRNLLEVIDERFEQLALEYDEDEIGDLEDAAADGVLGGVAEVDKFAAIIDEYYNTREKQAAVGRSAIADQLEAAGLSDEDGDVAIFKAKEALHRAEAREAAHHAQQDGNGNGIGGQIVGDDDVLMMMEVSDRQRERWDCESVLSLRSNLDNHPGKIVEETGRSRRRRRAASTGGGTGEEGGIVLNKHGFPKIPGQYSTGNGNGNGGDGLDEDEDEDDEEEEGEGMVKVKTPILLRKKGESAEEKKARKTAVKEAARHARLAKKELKMLFTAEAQAAKRRQVNAPVQAAIVL